MKKENGITLIALVITIIVLLILAGISISLTLGNNGVLTQSTNAVETNRKATAKEEVEIAWAGAESDYWAEWANNSELIKTANFYDTKLKVYLSSTGHDISVSDGEDEGTYEVNYTSNDQNQSYTFLIDENGKATPLVIGNAAEIARDKLNIGKAVNYNISYSGPADKPGWKILYADEKNVYIITNGYISNTNLNISDYSGTSDFSDLTRFPAVKAGWLYKIYGTNWTSSYKNIKETEFLLDSSKWGDYKDSNYAKWVIGGPTLELLVASYNSVYTNNKKAIGDLNRYGYPEVWSRNALSGSTWVTGQVYYIAGPSYYREDCITGIPGWDAYNAPYDQRPLSARPVVCLKSNVVLSWNETNNCYDLSLAQ